MTKLKIPFKKIWCITCHSYNKFTIEIIHNTYNFNCKKCGVDLVTFEGLDND